MNADRQLPGGVGCPPTGLDIRPHAPTGRARGVFHAMACPTFEGLTETT